MIYPGVACLVVGFACAATGLWIGIKGYQAIIHNRQRGAYVEKNDYLFLHSSLVLTFGGGLLTFGAWLSILGCTVIGK